MSRSEIQGNTDLNWNSTAIFLLGHAVQLEIGVDCQEQDGSKTWRVKTETTPTHTRQFECEPERSNILALHSLDFILQSVYTYMADPVVLFNVLIWPRVFAIGQETQRLAIWHKDANAGVERWKRTWTAGRTLCNLTLDYSIAETQKDLQIPQFFAKGQSISSTRVETHAGLV